ncbi:MAG TPA: GAF domain-containing protein [Candidatus Dormibacteraeota bacterium]|nr:GAF domain-containing protein [Candidatus Dormibacteraeota bacterium]
MRDHRTGTAAPARWGGRTHRSGRGVEALAGREGQAARPAGARAQPGAGAGGDGVQTPPVAALAPPQEVVGALGELALAAARPTSLEHLAFLTVDLARDLLGADAGSLFLWHEDGGHLAPVAHNDPAWDPKAIRCFAPGEGATGAAFQADRPLVIHDYPSSAYAVATAVSQGLKSGIATALTVGHRRVGVISARSYRHATWTPEHLRLLTVIGALAGPGLEQALVRSRHGIRLTPREEQVLVDLMAGRAAKGISRARGISEATVRTHIRSLLAKFGVNSQLAAVALARDFGFGPQPGPPGDPRKVRS